LKSHKNNCGIKISYAIFILGNNGIN